MPVAVDSSATPDAPPLIELDQASVIRGQVRVLHALRLRIALGQHTAILGPNGCGKSSFIKLITRELYPLARGDGQPAVKVLGQTRWQVDRLRAHLGIVSGDLSGNLAQMPELDVESAVLSGFSPATWCRRTAKSATTCAPVHAKHWRWCVHCRCWSARTRSCRPARHGAY